MIGVDVSTHSTTCVLIGMFVEENFACSGITQVGTIGAGFVYHIELKSRTVGVEVG